MSSQDQKIAIAQRYYPNFDLMRLLLAFEVVFDHARYMANPQSTWAAPIMAVPAFLAISGFLVLKSYEESGSWLVFIKRRMLRIMPALAASMVLCFVLFDWFAVYNSLLNWVTGGLYTLEGVANGPLWSLAWEELAYVALAVLWTLGAYRRPLAIWALLALSLLVVRKTQHLTPHTQTLFLLAPAFFVGNLMYLYRGTLLKVHGVVPWLFLLVILLPSHTPYLPMVMNLSPIVFQSFAVVWTGMAGTQAIAFRFPDISYGAYIYHMPIIIYLIRQGIVNDAHSMAIWLPIPLIVACIASWYYVEKPALRLKNKRRAAAETP